MSAEEHQEGCTVTVFQEVDVAAEIRVRPHASCGPPRIYCEESWIASGNDHLTCSPPDFTLPKDSDTDCSVWVIQRLCVAIPVHFDVDAICTEKRITCKEASTKSCRPGPQLERGGGDCSYDESSCSDMCSTSSSSGISDDYSGEESTRVRT